MPMDTTDEMYQRESTPKKPDTDDSNDDSMEDSTLIPKSIVPHEAKVGDVCKFKITHIWEDELEIQYMKKDKKDKDSDDDKDGDDDRPKKRERHHHHHHDDDEDFLSDRKVSMMGIGDIGTPGAGP